LEIHKLITSVWKKEKLPGEWKESIILPIHKKGDKTDCNNYRGISLLPTTYKILSNFLLSKLIPYAKEIIGVLITPPPLMSITITYNKHHRC